MRAGLLSDPRVVALLTRHFVPCHVAALNTAECMVDPRDAATLQRFVSPDTDRFQGGEREAFVLPDGTMQKVFLSLHGPDRYNGQTHMTAEGRRSAVALLPFREHAEGALRAAHGELPADWDDLWAGTAPAVAEIAGAAPRFPEPAPGTAALRVFVRNSYRMYDDLHGTELVTLAPELEAAMARALQKPDDRWALPAPLFLALAQATAPRGQVATRLRDESMQGELVLRVTGRDGDLVTGVVEGCFALTPADKSEVGTREHAATRFASRGRWRGAFQLDQATSRLRELRAVAADVTFGWILPFGGHENDFPPRHQIAVQWLATPGGGGDR